MVIDGHTSGEYSPLTHTHHPFLIRAPAVAQLNLPSAHHMIAPGCRLALGHNIQFHAVLGSTVAFIPSSFVGYFELSEIDRQPQLPKYIAPQIIR